MPFSILLPLIAQAAALNGPGTAGLNLPQIDRPRAGTQYHRGVVFDFPTPPSRLKTCLDAASADSSAAEASARGWLHTAPKGSLDAAQANLCLGAALSLRGEFASAEAAFLTGREAAIEPILRAQLGGMAGNAALAQAAPDRALPLLDAAQADAQIAGKGVLSGSIAIDRARALVALKRPAEAAEALTQARAAVPDDALAWLLSATLSRRSGDLPQAQLQIENAARLDPADPDTGVEAGVIAMLSGHEEAARKSWESVLRSAPGTEQAKRATAYLAQIAPSPNPAPNTVKISPQTPVTPR